MAGNPQKRVNQLLWSHITCCNIHITTTKTLEQFLHTTELHLGHTVL